MFSSLPNSHSVMSAPRPADGSPERMVIGMDVALVERAQDDVDHADGDEEQHPEILRRFLKDLGRALEADRDRGRQHLARDLADVVDGRAKRHAGPQPERDRHRRQLSRVIDALRADGFLRGHDGLERHERAARAS